MYLLSRNKKHQHKKEGKNMEQLLWYLISGVIGMFFGMLVVYLWMSDNYATKKHQKQVAGFVTRMRKLNKNGRITTIEKSIKEFGYQCMNFDLQVFRNLKTPEFNAIADCILKYDNQKIGAQSFQDDGVNSIYLHQISQEYVSDQEIHTKICEIFRKIIYKK